jgi:hypothetical protein
MTGICEVENEKVRSQIWQPQGKKIGFFRIMSSPKLGRDQREFVLSWKLGFMPFTKLLT